MKTSQNAEIKKMWHICDIYQIKMNYGLGQIVLNEVYNIKLQNQFYLSLIIATLAWTSYSYLACVAAA